MAASGVDPAQALLNWYRAMGVDEAIGEVPVNHFAAPSAEGGSGKPRPESKTSRAEPQQASLLGGASPIKAESLAELEALAGQFEGCALKRTAKNLCFVRGSDHARIMFIGEAPGRDEDLQGKPFVGRAGKLLDRMLASIGLAENDVYITNTVYWRPPGNRTPTPQEIESCAPFLKRQIELLKPDIIVLLGGAAAKSILGVSEGIMRLRGKWLNYQSGGRDIPTIATLHPAYLLRNPEAKRQAWRDMLMVKQALEQEK
ncbi:MAG: uracil-DNA glycosylase [Methyloceanibacter sp.]